jgi:hypothetical protein
VKCYDSQLVRVISERKITAYCHIMASLPSYNLYNAILMLYYLTTLKRLGVSAIGIYVY